jgi:hypothetical protein
VLSVIIDEIIQPEESAHFFVIDRLAHDPVLNVFTTHNAPSCISTLVCQGRCFSNKFMVHKFVSAIFIGTTLQFSTVMWLFFIPDMHKN